MPKVASSVNIERNARERERNQTIQNKINEIARFLNIEHLRKLDVLDEALKNLQEYAHIVQQERMVTKFVEIELYDTHHALTDTRQSLEEAHLEISRLRTINASNPQLALAEQNYSGYYQQTAVAYQQEGHENDSIVPSSSEERNETDFSDAQPQEGQFSPQLETTPQASEAGVEFATTRSYEFHNYNGTPLEQMTHDHRPPVAPPLFEPTNVTVFQPYQDVSAPSQDSEDLPPSDGQIEDYQNVEINFDYFLNDDDDFLDFLENQDDVSIPVPAAEPENASPPSSDPNYDVCAFLMDTQWS